VDRETYLDRVRPLLGERFFDARVTVWGLGVHYLAAEALARTGLTRQTWFDDEQAGGALCRSLGFDLAGVRRGTALARRCRQHNPAEEGWALVSRPPRADGLRRHLNAGNSALLLASSPGSDGDGAAAVARAAVDSGTPLVFTFTPRGVAAVCAQLVWRPGSAADPGRVVQAARALGELPGQDLDRSENHLDGLEARSMALSLARWLLAPESPTRPDLERPLLEQGRALAVRARPEWPWSTLFLRPTARALDEIGRPAAWYRPPLKLLRKQRLLVLGLGTASLFCAEAGLISRDICLVDAKQVSPFNPVRQVYGADEVGRPKAEALCDILRERIEPGASWSRLEDGPLTRYRGDGLALSHAELHLSARRRASVQRFEEILDRFKPTLAVVGMGRSKDDNFTATAALRRRGIRHVTPTAFPAVTHFKHVLTDGDRGPCYDCIQGHLPLDGGAGPELDRAEREIFYGGTQPATLAETLPSAHSLLRLAAGLALPDAARPPYLRGELAAERVCFVGANRTQRNDAGWLYGVDRPFTMVTYGVEDLLGGDTARRCACGRLNRPPHC